MAMASVNSSAKVEIPEWKPTAAQRATFDEWKGFTIGHLVSCKMGVQPYKLPALLQEQTGDRIPLQKMGLPVSNINHFLFQMSDDLLLRIVDGSLFVFIKESAVPDQMDNIRKMVLGQRKDRNDYPLRYHGEYARFTELLKLGVIRPPQQFQSASGSGHSGWGNSTTARRNAQVGGNGSRQPRRGGGGGSRSSNYSGRRFNLHGLDDDDDSDYDDMGGFDFCSGVPASRELEKPKDECGPPAAKVVAPAPKVESPPKEEQGQAQQTTPSSGIKNEIGATVEEVKAKMEPELSVVIPARPRIGRGRARPIPWMATVEDNMENLPPKVAGYSMADMAPAVVAPGSNILKEAAPPTAEKTDSLEQLQLKVKADPDPGREVEPTEKKVDIDVLNILPGQGRRFKPIWERTREMAKSPGGDMK